MPPPHVQLQHRSGLPHLTGLDSALVSEIYAHGPHPLAIEREEAVLTAIAAADTVQEQAVGSRTVLSAKGYPRRTPENPQVSQSTTRTPSSSLAAYMASVLGENMIHLLPAACAAYDGQAIQTAVVVTIHHRGVPSVMDLTRIAPPFAPAQAPMEQKAQASM